MELDDVEKWMIPGSFTAWWDACTIRSFDWRNPEHRAIAIAYTAGFADGLSRTEINVSST